MEQFLIHILSSTSGVGSYGLVFGVLLCCGMGVPLPEDVVLVTGGFLVFLGEARLDAMMLTGMLGILFGDSILYFFGHHFGESVSCRWPFKLLLTPSKRQTVMDGFVKHGEKIVVTARFMPGVRAVTYFFAGSSGMSYFRFLFFDSLASLISAPLFIFLGYHFGARIHWVIQAVRRGQWTVILIIIAVLLVWVGLRHRRRRRAEQGTCRTEN
jgi:membrane protein DedA with SNARE-associated domain